MGYRGHACISLIIFLAVFFLGRALGMTWSLLVGTAPSIFLGGLFPDIDTASRGRRLFTILLLALLLWCLLTRAYITALATFAVLLLPLLVRHRTIFHNLLFIGCFTALVASIFFTMHLFYLRTILLMAALFFVGCWGHLVADFGFKGSLKMHR
ncbi:MAG: metal-dependent hydrolase [Candidatus Dependentiae bacterium]|nr:metal-dependent hydrolase [Candidatus Dependentiae bacterium]